MTLKRIAIIGANGHLGPHILKSLTSNPTFSVTVLTRASSTSQYQANIKVATIPDDLPHASLVSALTDHDALILAVSGSQTSVSLQLIAAANDAGVSRIIPADFGSCDSQDPRSLSLLPLYGEKKRVRDHLIDLVKETQGRVSWTSIVCAHFLDYGLQGGLMQIDVPRRKARVFDGGDVMFSASMLRTVGQAVVGVLLHSEETRDRVVYVHSVRTCQNELVETVERVVGKGGFEVEHRASDGFIKELQAVLSLKPDDHQTIEDLVGVEGIVNADWKGKEDFCNDLFGLPEEDLETVVRESLVGML